MATVFVLLSVFLPILCGLGSYFLNTTNTKIRNAFHISVIAVTCLMVWASAIVSNGETIVLLHFKEGIEFALKLDGAGKFFACMSATLWLITSIYATDYMSHEQHLRSFWMFFTSSMGITMGIAMAANVMTMYLFYEMLTICTIPLVLHGREAKDIKAAKKYMIYSFGGAAFALSGVAYLILSNANDFIYGGSLSSIDGTIGLVMFLFAFFGFGVKAAVFPLHGWLPSASVAPTPVTALLHAVAVVKAGAFAIIRIIYYSFGTGTLAGTNAQYIAFAFAGFTIVYGSLQALRQQHFKRRLAYSTVSNLSYIVMAALIMSRAGFIAAFVHILVHSVTKIEGFFCAGSVLHYTKKEYLEDMNGIGYAMPLNFACFIVTALSLTGIPGFGGFTSKWMIATAAVEQHSALGYIGVTVLLISALLTAIYMFSIVVRAFFPVDGRNACTIEKTKISWRMMVPMVICSLMALLTGIFASSLVTFVEGVLAI